MVNNNSNLYEGSTISPLPSHYPAILWLARFGTVFPPDWRVKLSLRLIFACILADGTEDGTARLASACSVSSCCATRSAFLYVPGPACSCGSIHPARFLHRRMSTIQLWSRPVAKPHPPRVWGWTWTMPRRSAGRRLRRYRQTKIEAIPSRRRIGRSLDGHRPDRNGPRPRLPQFLFEMLGEQGFPG